MTHGAGSSPAGGTGCRPRKRLSTIGASYEDELGQCCCDRLPSAVVLGPARSLNRCGFHGIARRMAYALSAFTSCWPTRSACGRSSLACATRWIRRWLLQRFGPGRQGLLAQSCLLEVVRACATFGEREGRCRRRSTLGVVLPVPVVRKLRSRSHFTQELGKYPAWRSEAQPVRAALCDGPVWSD